MGQTLAEMEVEMIKEKFKILNDPLNLSLLDALDDHDKEILNENGRILGLHNNMVKGFSDYQNLFLEDIRKIANKLFQLHFPGNKNVKFSVMHVRTGSPNAFVCDHESDKSMVLGFDTSFFDYFKIALIAGVYYCEEISCDVKNQEIKCFEFLELAKSISLAFRGRESGRMFGKQVNVLLKSIENKYPGQLAHFLQYSDFVYLPTLCFIVAHEIGHIKLNHTKSSGQMKYTELSSDKAQLLVFKHKQELDSDEWGFFALSSFERTEGFKLLYSKAPALFFAVLLVFEKFCQPQTDLGKQIHSTHPPLEERINLFIKLSKSLPTDGIEDSILKEAEFLETMTSFFLESSKVSAKFQIEKQ